MLALSGFGATAGRSWLHILRGHRHVEALLMEHRSDARATAGCGNRRGLGRFRRRPRRCGTRKIEIVFLATPPEVSMELAPAMLDAGARVIDLSGAFRLRTPENYARWYRARTRSRRCSPKRSTDCRSFAASAFPARGWWRIPAAIRRRRIWRSGRWSRRA